MEADETNMNVSVQGLKFEETGPLWWEGPGDAVGVNIPAFTAAESTRQVKFQTRNPPL
jgi:hypothetical protein